MALKQVKPIVVVGSINMDLVARCPHIAAAGETLTGSDFVTTPGGKGANQAVSGARLGYAVTMVGCVGGDVFGEALRTNLAESGVDTAGVTRVDGPSGVAQIQVADSGENSIVVVPGANGKLTPELIDRHAAIVRGAGMVLCQLEVPMETVEHTLRMCSEAGVPVMLDPAPAVGLPDSFWSLVNWFTPNETEAALYVDGAGGVEKSAALLLERGVNGVVLKRGGEGAYVASDRAGQMVPAFAVEAVDTVGAGDCFNGAFAVGLLEGQGPAEAARFASAAAAISVTRRGAQASMPDRAEVDTFLAQHS